MVGLRLLRSLVPPYSLTLTLFLKLTTKQIQNAKVGMFQTARPNIDA
jgi:hypothetical protein